MYKRQALDIAEKTYVNVNIHQKENADKLKMCIRDRCGDQVDHFEVGDEVYLLLCDGMGSGQEAHREAAMTVRPVSYTHLFPRFYPACAVPFRFVVPHDPGLHRSVPV